MENEWPVEINSEETVGYLKLSPVAPTSVGFPRRSNHAPYEINAQSMGQLSRRRLK
jgi:hypothetical protein